mgnify:CR=1 FL=1
MKGLKLFKNLKGFELLKPLSLFYNLKYGKRFIT